MSTLSKKNIGATPAKLALIVVLSVVFAYVVFGGLSDSPQRTQARRSSESTESGLEPTAPSINSHETIHKPVLLQETERPWPSMTLAEITKSDPFAYSLPGDEIRSQQTTTEELPREELVDLEQLRDATGAIVLLSSSEKVARYGSTELRVGDLIDGYRVRDITPQGIVFTEHD